ncbi:MAG TPA: adenosine deaminase [Candidatus Methylomirabilis sp.]|nr:adenosine deaminase [Candidatus Methylomirabilis sp.]
MLRMFLQEMPKGGDLHTHLTGAVYAESYIAWAAEEGLCADPGTSTITTCCAPTCPTRPVADALKDGVFYRTLVDGLSMRNLSERPQSGHNHFFEVFGRFNAATTTRGPEMVAELTTRAADEHVMYLEIMETLRGSQVRQLGSRVAFDKKDLAGSHQRLIDAGLPALVPEGMRDLDTIERRVAVLLGCVGNEPPAPCRVTRRYLQQTTRTAEPAVVFAQLTYAFELAQKDPRVVGLSLVAPEDDRVALRDYRLHMQMIEWLNGQYPGVNVTLHAGELALGLVPPADLRFHIRDAVLVAKAKRIGHGVAIAYEADAAQLLQKMRERDVAVEICLTSNDIILGVKGTRHPFPAYLRAGVPAVLATDDEGVSRSDLTNEYVRAAETYRLGYRELKQLSRNSLTYSFLPGQSLWLRPEGRELVPDCAGQAAQPSPTCQAFLDASEKARMQWQLERAFEAFEATASGSDRQ